MGSYEIALLGGPDGFKCRDDQSVLSALAPVYNNWIVSGCHGGGCGVCKIRVFEGKFDCGKMSKAHVSVAERDQLITLACQTFPRSNMRIEPCGKLTRRFAMRAACEAAGTD